MVKSHGSFHGLDSDGFDKTSVVEYLSRWGTKDL